MKKILVGIAASIIFVLALKGVADTFDRPLIVVDGATNQLIRMTMSDKKGNTITISDYRDPRYRRVLKDDKYDYTVIR